MQEVGLVSDAPPEADERELVARALGRDEEALGRLLTLHQEWAYNLAYRVLGHEADARDAVQDAFLRTVRSLRGDGSPPRNADSFKPWLRRVVTNAAVTQIRRRGAHTTTVDAVADSLPGPVSGEPGHAVDQVETRGQVLQVLLGLPETQRVALALREYLDASYDDIAEVLDLPRTAIGTLLFRARAAFRASYDRVAASAPPQDCPDVVPLFASIVDGEPRPDSWQALEEHLRTCEACGGELESQRRARRMYALLPLLALPAGWEPVRAVLSGMAAGGAGAGAASAGASAAAATGPASGAGASAAAPAATTPAAGTTGELASGSAAAPVAASASTPAVGAGGLASGGGLAGLATVASGAKLTLAALATAVVVGAGVVAAPFVGPFVGPEATPATSPSPIQALAASPSPGPGASPDVAVLPGVAASPSGTSVTALIGAPPALGAAQSAASSAPGPSPSPSPPGAGAGGQAGSTPTPAVATPTPAVATPAPPTVGPAGAASPTPTPPGSPTPLRPQGTP
jgi:RNA polymerase sigma factor (sigma-70 family)